MQKMLVVILGIFGIILVFFLFRPMTDELKDFRTDVYTNNYTNVDTGAGVTNASVTLSRELWRENTDEVVSIASNNTNDVPVAEGYVTASQLLYIKGLEANSSRNFTVQYNIDDLEEYSGLSEISGLSPLILFLAFIGVILALIILPFVKSRIG
jgi:hypothetical protein